MAHVSCEQDWSARARATRDSLTAWAAEQPVARCADIFQPGPPQPALPHNKQTQPTNQPGFRRCTWTGSFMAGAT